MGFNKKNDGCRKWWVYKITNPNGREYIGVTSQINKRINHYKKASNKSQTLIMRSIKKYGWDSHFFSILDEMYCNTSAALSKEIFWIRSHMSNFSKYPEMKGMNLTDGGEGALGYKLSEEAKKKLSVKNRQYRHTDEAKRKIGEAAKVNLKGRKLTEETKNKLRKANLGKKYSEETRQKLSEMRKGKKINRVWSEDEKQRMRELKKDFKHTDEAKKKIGEASKGNKHNIGRKMPEKTKEAILKAIKGNKYNLGRKQSEEQKMQTSLRFKGKKRSKAEIEKIQKGLELKLGKKIATYDIDLNKIKEYPSINSLCMDLGVNRSNVREKLKNGNVFSKINMYIKYI